MRISKLLEEGLRGGTSKSSVLTPLQWPIAICVIGALGSAKLGAPWLAGSFFALTAVLALCVICGWWYFAAKDHSALRSEKYQLQLKQMMLGDSSRGLHETSLEEQRSLVVGASDDP